MVSDSRYIIVAVWIAQCSLGDLLRTISTGASLCVHIKLWKIVLGLNVTTRIYTATPSYLWQRLTADATDVGHVLSDFNSRLEIALCKMRPILALPFIVAQETAKIAKDIFALALHFVVR